MLTETQESLSSARSGSLTKPGLADRPAYSPPPARTDQRHEVASSPYSLRSHGSQDGLIRSSNPTATDAPNSPYGSSPTLRYNRVSIPPNTTASASSGSPSHRPRMQRPGSSTGAGLRRSTVYASPRDSDSMRDEDARLLLDSISAGRRLNRQSNNLSSSHDGHVEVNPHPASLPISSTTASREMDSSPRLNSARQRLSSIPLFDSNDQEFQASLSKLDSSETTPRAKPRDLGRQPQPLPFDSAYSPHPRAALPRQGNPPSANAGGQHKIMTPAQFNQYKMEQEMKRTNSNASKSEDSDEDEENYDDDDQTERNRLLAKQRRKQEAHLAVYRQQMMKMTGEQPSELPNMGQFRPPIDRASTTPNLGSDNVLGKCKSSDDEDEDIPLGILAAHGFPGKNRPPSVFSNVGSNPYIRYKSESYPPPVSAAATVNAGGGRGLPAFARNLPADPYYGAGLVNPSNREPLAFGTHGGASFHVNQAPNLPPGGLVGVIAGEERARAMRRGSPNAQGNYGSPLPPGMPQTQGPMLPGGMPMPMPMVSPGDEAQIHMSHQMAQMMQMQMQWMHQMQQMVAGGVQGPGTEQQAPFSATQQHPFMNNGFLAPPNQMARPMSMSSNLASAVPISAQQPQQRAMSMMGPSTSSQWAPSGTVRLTAPSMMSGALGSQGYTPSIAPSERSNVGMPSRYRPVSIAPIGEVPRPSSRASISASGSLQVGSNGHGVSSTTARPAHPMENQGPTVPDDDDDEEGWVEMKKEREKKKTSWRTKRKDEHGLQDVYYPNS